MRQTVHYLPPHSFRTLSHLLAHLHLLSQLSDKTGMTSRNLALVWAPNLLRSQHETIASEESLRDIGVQARVVEFLIERYQELFIREKEVTRLRGNLSCQDVSFLPVSNQRSFHGSYASLEKTLPRCEEEVVSSRPQAGHFIPSNRDSQYLCKVGSHSSLLLLLPLEEVKVFLKNAFMKVMQYKELSVLLLWQNQNLSFTRNFPTRPQPFL